MQEARRQEARSNFAHCANLVHARKFEQHENSSSTKIHALSEFFYLREVSCFPFSAQNDPVCIFSNFTSYVITFEMGILVFHFFVRLYIAILCTIEGGGPGNRRKDSA